MPNELLVKLVFPQERKLLYNRIQLLFSKYGEEALKDCNATCSEHNKNVVTCWNLFIAATAAYNLGEIKKANVIWNHCEAQLNLIYRDVDIYPTKELNSYCYIGKVSNIEDYSELLQTETKYNKTIKGSILDFELLYGERIAIISKEEDLGALDESIPHPLYRETIDIDGEEWFYYFSKNTYSDGNHHIKFITHNYV